MKNLLLLVSLFAIAILNTGCPVGIDYPLGDPGKEKIDKRLLGTWVAEAGDTEMLRLTISKKDDYSYNIEVLEKGEMYSLETDYLNAWVTSLEGFSFIYGKPIDEGNQQYYHYHYDFDGNNLVVVDMSLLEGGMDAVTSRETLRKEVAASVKKPDFMATKVVYVKE